MEKHQTRILLIWTLLFVSIFFPCLSTEPRYEPKHSFKSPFLLVRGTYLPYWEFGGSAVITEEYVRLTPAIKSRTGSIWNIEPVRFRNWEVTIEFRIGGGGKLGADGLAFWYSPDIRQEGPVFGMKDQWKGLAVVFDTFDNDGMRDNPQVVAIINDGTKQWREDGKHLQFGGCHAQFRNPYKNVKAKIRHVDGIMEVYLDTAGTGIWEPCVASTRVELPVGYHFGMTAATGGLFDNHDVYSFETFNLDNPDYTSLYQQQVQQPQAQEQHTQTQPPIVQTTPQAQEQPQGDAPFQNVLKKLNSIKDDGIAGNQPKVQASQEFVSPPSTQAQPIAQTVNTQQQADTPAPTPTPAPSSGSSSSPASQLCDPESSQSLRALSSQLVDLSTKVAALQGTLQQLNLGAATDLKTQLEQLKQQQSIFAEGFVDLLQAVATKTELENVRARSEQLHQTVVKEIGDTRAIVQDLKALVNTKLGTKNDDLVRTLEEVNQNVNQLKKGVEATRESSKKIESNLKQNAEEIATTIEKHTTFGFWTYFLFIQAIFIFGYIWWRKHKEDANKKLI